MKKSIISHFIVFSLFSVLSFAGAQAGKFEVGVYGGVGETFDSDVSLSQSGTNITHKDVEWDGDSFGPAPYWGARLTYWPETMPNWGFMLDYTHAKMKADLYGAVGATYNRLEFTDGLNLVTGNLVYKYDYSDTLRPYAGVGVGLAVPHVEVERTGQPRTFEYQVTGVAAQLLAGAEYQINENFAVFGEYKISYADIDADLTGGGSLETEGWTNHFVLGLSYKFDGP